MPIKDLDGEVLGVAQAINKISAKDEPFDEHDEKVRPTPKSPVGPLIRGTKDETQTFMVITMY